MHQHFGKLKDWVKVLDCFQTAIQSLNNTKTWQTGGSAQLRLFRSLCQVDGAKDTFKILTNIIIAALHINFLAVHPFQKEEMPRLMSRIDLLTEIVSSGNQLTEDEEAYFNTLMEDSQEDSVIRLPLQLALRISPLYLLFLNKLCRKDVFGRQSIINVSPRR